MGKPMFTDAISTAAVSFNEEGDFVHLLFNPDFWKKLTVYERLFVLSHETLHVILNHGFRTADAEDNEIVNKALDVVVNHLLVNRFGFVRSKISFEKTLCWVDTIWPDKDIPSDKNFEFYFNLLKKSKPETLGSLSLVDDHSGLAENPKNWQEVIDAFGDVLSDDEKESLREVMEKHFQLPEQDDKTNSQHEPGTISGCGWVIVSAQVAKKKKWETVIKKWAKKYDRPELHDVEQWARTNRRFVNLSPDLFLPTDMEVEHDNEGKIQVWFFQDTSGSCAHLAKRFFTAAKSLPDDRFDVKMHCFDTRVFETTLESGKLFGFGGTCFRSLEAYIQAYMKKNGTKYPQAVFVITDGQGTPVKPEKPEVWYWFLDPFVTHCIPVTCNKFHLKNFE